MQTVGGSEFRNRCKFCITLYLSQNVFAVTGIRYEELLPKVQKPLSNVDNNPSYGVINLNNNL